MTGVSYDVVIPTSGRPSLAMLLEALASGTGPRPGRVFVVADGSLRALPNVPEVPLELEVMRAGPGPAAARNAGWRASRAEWIAFLDDDVVPGDSWHARLARDLAAAPRYVGGSQGRLRVPLATGRRPTDWERNVQGLERASWATADMAYRRPALAAVGGFDERFRRAYREDADLALRVRHAGFHLARGERVTLHPARPSGRWASVRAQAGNADDVLMWALHGRRWREEVNAPPGRFGRHLPTAVAGAASVALLLGGRRRGAAAAGLAWLAGTTELASARIRPGPRTADEVATMLATSAALPFAAVLWRAVGLTRLPRQLGSHPRAPAAILLDRDGTLVVDEPYNGDPERVVPMPGAREALERLRAAGVPTAVISNQSGVGRGLLTLGQVEAVNRRVVELLGPLGPWVVCPHRPEELCGCRKPAPGLVLRAADMLGVRPERCAVIGDIGSDVDAARAAGARAVLVPTPRTRPEEIDSAAEVARDLPGAVALLLGDAG